MTAGPEVRASLSSVSLQRPPGPRIRGLVLALLVLALIVVGVPLVAATALVMAVVVPLALLPELPFVLLTNGMFVFALVPGVAGFFEGIAIPIIAAAAGVAVLIQVYGNILGSKGLPVFSWVLPDVLILALMGWIWAGTSWSSDTVYGVKKAIGFTLYTGFPYLFIRWLCVARRFPVRRMIFLMGLVGACHALMILDLSLQAGSIRPDVLDQGFKRAMRGSPLGFGPEGGALSLGLVSTLALGFALRGRMRLYLVTPLFFIQLWALMRLQQRGPMLATVAGSLVFLLYMLPIDRQKGVATRRRAGYILLLAPFVVVAMLALIAFNPQADLAYVFQDESVLERLRLYLFAWDAFLSNALVGVGTGNSGLTLTGGVGIYDELFVHNIVLEVMVELGLIGVLILVALTISYVRRLFRVMGETRSWRLHLGIAFAGACLVSRYVVGMFGPDLIQWNIGVWAGLMVALSETPSGSAI